LALVVFFLALVVFFLALVVFFLALVVFFLPVFLAVFLAALVAFLVALLTASVLLMVSLTAFLIADRLERIFLPSPLVIFLSAMARVTALDSLSASFLSLPSLALRRLSFSSACLLLVAEAFARVCRSSLTRITKARHSSTVLHLAVPFPVMPL